MKTMVATMQTCDLVLRQLKPGAGITETSLPVTTLEELFAYCVTKAEPQLVERLLLAGRDADGQQRVLTFTFQSVTQHQKLTD
ncbi:MAG TPA: hypothetical protein VE775_03005 [Pyrinomonadaceae bacterium]|nr:hypothetical protein [Pyrinomonadaceae bacterium]